MRDIQTFDDLESEVRLYSRVFPAVFERARNALVFAEDGHRFIDFFCGAGALNYGHNPPHVRARLIEYLEKEGIVHALDAFTVEKRTFLRELSAAILQPRDLDYKVQFCGPTGTNAVEAALKLARAVTGRHGVIAFGGGFHGMSLGSASVSGGGARRAAGVPVAGSAFVPYETGPHGRFDSLGLIERLLDDPSSGVDPPAAIIVESVQMDGGVYAASPEFLRGLSGLAARSGALLIADEIQTGAGRTGPFFGFERAGLTPDLVTVSKSISGYGLPLSLLLIKREHDRWQPGDHTGTFRANQLALVAATAVLELWKSSVFLAGAGNVSSYLDESLSPALRDVHPDLDVRSVGAVVGVDFGRCGGAGAAERVANRCFERGLILERCGRRNEVIKVMPPLTIPGDELAEGGEILLASVRECVGRPAGRALQARRRPG